MPEIIPTVKRNLQDRFDNIRDAVTDEIDIFKGAWKDIKHRIVKAEEPELGKKYIVPGTGIVGGLGGTVAAIPIATVDNLGKHVRKSGEITRRWFER